MTQGPIKFFSWFIGQRVARKDSDEQGKVVETRPRLKVKWDGGQISYYRRDQIANVEKIQPAP